jgi:hypothetical protein
VIFTPALSCSVSTGLVPPNSRESNVLDSVAEGVGAGIEICVGNVGEGAETASEGDGAAVDSGVAAGTIPS